jgi:hypothetical protein
MTDTANLARDHLLVQPSINAGVVAAGTDRANATPLLGLLSSPTGAAAGAPTAEARH